MNPYDWPQCQHVVVLAVGFPVRCHRHGAGDCRGLVLCERHLEMMRNQAAA